MNTTPLTTSQATRWRLVLGKKVENELGNCGLAGQVTLNTDQVNLDAALEQIYGIEEQQRSGSGSSLKRGAGLGNSAPQLAKWLGDIRSYFNQEVVAIIQKDAIERKGLKQLLFEPETLAQVTPNIELVGTLMSLKNMVPDRAKDAAREIVRAVVEDIMRRMRSGIEQAVRGAINRSRHSPFRSLPNLDWKRTIQRNLKNYNREMKVVIPESFHFFARQNRRKEWNIILCMDQSGSMADSVVYGGVCGAIFSSIPALSTHVVVFDTEVVDLTPQCHDPVDLLFGIQLGGGTDINRAVKYCEGLVTQPRKTIFVLITDLYEGGNQSELVTRMERLSSSGVKSICLLALADSGSPSYDENLAKKFANVGVPSFACTPKMLPTMLEGVLKGQDLFRLAQTCGTKKNQKT